MKTTRNPQSPQYGFSLDGLSSFLSIANRTITEQSHQGLLTEKDISAIHGNMQNAIYNLASALELLGAERIDYIKTDDNQALCGGLMIAGGVMREFASLNDTLESARHRLSNQKKPTEPHGFPPSEASEDWPSC